MLWKNWYKLCSPCILPLLPATIWGCRLELLENITAGVGQDFGSELLRVQVFHAGIGCAVSAAIRHTAHHRRLIFTARDHGTTDCHVSAIWDGVTTNTLPSGTESRTRVVHLYLFQKNVSYKTQVCCDTNLVKKVPNEPLVCYIWHQRVGELKLALGAVP